jgi:hypothetical protein
MPLPPDSAFLQIRSPVAGTIHGVFLDRSALARIESHKRLMQDLEILAFAAALRVPIKRLFDR